MTDRTYAPRGHMYPGDILRVETYIQMDMHTEGHTYSGVYTPQSVCPSVCMCPPYIRFVMCTLHRVYGERWIVQVAERMSLRLYVSIVCTLCRVFYTLQCIHSTICMSCAYFLRVHVPPFVVC